MDDILLFEDMNLIEDLYFLDVVNGDMRADIFVLFIEDMISELQILKGIQNETVACS